MSEGNVRQIEIPDAFKPLFRPKRYKVMYGGRGSGKSTSMALCLLIQGYNEKLRILCAREFQTSISDSVHKMLGDMIKEYGFNGDYEVQQARIINRRNGTEFIFKGLRHNANEIKSTEGIDRCWVEEAEKVSDNSWELLIPTIRKPGSEIWVSFNNKQPTDPTYVRMVVNADDDYFVKKVSYRDNPFFPEVLEKERLRLLKADPEAYKHIWEGEFDTRFFGGVYTQWMERARNDNRIVSDLYDKTLPVHTSWDLGYDDATAIWWFQVAGDEIRYIDYYENTGQDIKHYCDVVSGKKYKYGAHYVPHDGNNKLLAAGGRSIVQQAYGYGVKMAVVPATTQQNQIEAGRVTIDKAWFDKDKCKLGIECLMKYQFEYDEDKMMFKSSPRHDKWSHGADAFEISALRWRTVPEVEISEGPKFKFLQDATFNEIMWPSNTGTKHERFY